MPAMRYRSRTLRRVKKVTPGGKNVVHYKKRKPSPAKCGNCGKPLGGVPSERPYKMRTLAKTKKRPERAYGGVLCPSCLKAKLKEEARAK